PSTAHSRSAICSQKIGLRRVSDCAAALRSLDGATMLTVPIFASPSASARRPGAKIPSSFVTKIFGMKNETNYKSNIVQPEGFADEAYANTARKWSGRLDSNQRPHAPQACALPGCATSRPLQKLPPANTETSDSGNPERVAVWRSTGSKNSVSPRFEEGQGGEKLFAKIEQVFALRAGKFVVALASGRRRGNRLSSGVGDSTLLGQMAARSRDCEAFVVEQALDFEYGFDVFAAVHAMPAGALHRL